MDDGTVGVGATQHAEILAGWCGMTPAAKFTYYQTGGHGGAWIHAYDTGHITVPVVVTALFQFYSQSKFIRMVFKSYKSYACCSGCRSCTSNQYPGYSFNCGRLAFAQWKYSCL